jgi:hypothetical protein
MIMMLVVAQVVVMIVFLRAQRKIDFFFEWGK